LPHDCESTPGAQAGFQRVFAEFTPDVVRSAVEAVHAPEPWFNDTLRTIRDRAQLAEYMAATASAVDDCRVTVDEFAPARIGWYVRWRMTIRFRRFRRGVDTHSIGMSHVVLDREGRIVLHQDFRDAADGLFEHVPVVGWAIRRIKRRL